VNPVSDYFLIEMGQKTVKNAFLERKRKTKEQEKNFIVQDTGT
jgi:hypothetical protein